MLADLGKPDALAPVTGDLRDSAGTVIGGYTLAVQDDRAYVQVLHRISTAEVLLRSGRRQVLGSIASGPATIPSRGRVRYRGQLYAAASFGADRAFWAIWRGLFAPLRTPWSNGFTGTSRRTASGMVGWFSVCPAMRDRTAFSAPDSGMGAN